MGRRLIELPLWVLAGVVLTAGAIGCALGWARGRRT